MKKKERREIRKKRVRRQISGTTERPRLSVFRSNKHLYAQVIDDQQHSTKLGMGDVHLSKNNQKGSKTEIAKVLGEKMGKKMKAAKITKVIFDRGEYQYHGRIKAFADGVRAAGISF